jgi:5-aminolevulinate synthase
MITRRSQERYGLVGLWDLKPFSRPSAPRPRRAAIRHLKTSQWERQRQQDRTRRVKAALGAAALPVMLSDTHIVPVAVGDPEKCKAVSDLLLSEHGIYIHPINYPTERLRITPTPCHEDIMIDQLAAALIDVWNQLGLPRHNLAYAAE